MFVIRISSFQDEGLQAQDDYLATEGKALPCDGAFHPAMQCSHPLHAGVSLLDSNKYPPSDWQLADF